MFGVLQWFLFFASLLAFVAAMALSLQLTNPVSGESWFKFVPTGLARSYLFTLQLGEHPDDVKLNGLRIQSMVLSLFTAMIFIYYAGCFYDGYKIVAISELRIS